MSTAIPEGLESLITPVLTLWERQVKAQEATAIALTRIAQAVPFFHDDVARWAFRVADAAVPEHPVQPDSVKDPKARTAMLAFALGEQLAYSHKRRVENEERKAERDAADPGSVARSASAY